MQMGVRNGLASDSAYVHTEIETVRTMFADQKASGFIRKLENRALFIHSQVKPIGNVSSRNDKHMAR